MKKYFEEKGERKRDCEINRIVAGGVGVKRSTGQHPGGIIVLPYGEEIHSFTPIQHPANDMTTNIVTTHFDYHSIDHNLLKLDILGHDDPTMIRMLQDLTKMDPTTIPLDNPEVMSLFQSTEALKIKPEDIGGTALGCLGIPEFGTDFAMQMLIDTKPQHFSDLVRIAGLSHGTDVWLGNAQTLIEEGKATISTAICTRDDIMTYLINMGIEAGVSFKIMESVRKGKGLTPDWEALMEGAGVPDWYIWSCKKIKYMFPKAHAAAYVMMAWRIAYCKVFFPLEYYASYFSIRADDFSYELMCFGKEKLDKHIEDYRQMGDALSNKQQGQLKDMRIVPEIKKEVIAKPIFKSSSSGSKKTYNTASGGGTLPVDQGMNAGWQAWGYQTMDNGTEGCCEAATKVGSYHSPFLADECNKGVVSVPNLVKDAKNAGVPVLDFDASQLEKGDCIVYYTSEGADGHVTIYDGEGGYIGNSSSRNMVWHSNDYTDCGTPMRIIKTSHYC